MPLNTAFRDKTEENLGQYNILNIGDDIDTLSRGRAAISNPLIELQQPRGSSYSFEYRSSDGEAFSTPHVRKNT